MNKGLILFCSLFFHLLCFSTSQAALKIGVIFFDPPLVMSSIQGFHIDLANKICQGLQEQCTIMPMQWNQLFKALDKGEIDLQMGVFLTEERAKKYIFSLPYMDSAGRFMVLAANKFSTIEQLKNHTIGTLKEEENAGVFRDFFQTNFINYFTVLYLKDLDTLISSLMNKTIDGVFIHRRAVEYWVANNSGILTTLGPIFPLGQGYTIAALPRNQLLLNSVNQQIKRMQATGELGSIYATYFGVGPMQIK